MKKALLFLLAFGWLSGLQAQDQTLRACATPDYDNPWLERYQDNPKAYDRGNDDLLILPMVIHLLGTDGGGGFYPLNQLYRAFCELNQDMAPSGIRFYIQDINYIANSDYYEHQSFGTGFDMIVENNVPNAINSYIVETAAGACGYYSGGADAVVNAINCIEAGDNTWAHEMGHFFSLPHTFRGWESVDEPNYFEPAPSFVGGREVERADGSNCATAGDRFCDTPADYLNFRWSCNDEGRSNIPQFDPDSIMFFSEASFYMSYSFDACSFEFSNEQIDAMRANIFDQRSNLLGDVELLPDLSLDGFAPLFPQEAEMVNPNAVKLEWTEVPGATQYEVQLSLFKGFPGIPNVTFDTLVNSNSVTFFNLFDERTYYWKVFPYNNQGPCASYSELFSFQTSSSVTSVFNLDNGFELSVFPNPAGSGSPLQLQVTASEAGEFFLQLLSAGGQVIAEQISGYGPGRSIVRLANTPDTPGLYFLRIQRGDEVRVEKVLFF